MPSGMFMAPAISDEEVGDMLKAESLPDQGGCAVRRKRS
jgi:hypothetical protein